jgi:hypothetical protein
MLGLLQHENQGMLSVLQQLSLFTHATSFLLAGAA